MQADTRSHFFSSSSLHWTAASLFVIAILAWPTEPLRAGEVYKYVYPDGHVVYSDQAVPDPSSTPSGSEQAGSSNVAADTEIHAEQAPPPLTDYEQPPCPEDGYLWAPGYWAWGPDGWYWVPGAWARPPRPGLLWTPAFWQYDDSVYVFHRGYWAPHVGYYGGINYGHGYFGSGFVGGHWEGKAFAYNRSVSNVSDRVAHHFYDEPVANNHYTNRVSYNGGPGGTTSTPTARDRAVAAEVHFPATAIQRQSVPEATRQPAVMLHTYDSEVSTPGSSAEHRAAAMASAAAMYNSARASAMRSSATFHAGTSVNVPRGEAQRAEAPRATSTANPRLTAPTVGHSSSSTSMPRQATKPLTP